MTQQQPIQLGETLAIGSIEGFLTPEDAITLTSLMDVFLRDNSREKFEHNRLTSIHEIPGHTTPEAMQVYEPSGRVEITDIPPAAEQLLQAAFDRSRPAVDRVLRSVTSCRPWTYVEYGPGQHITPHVDGIAPDPHAWPRQVAGISVAIGVEGDGGQFFVETTSDENLWNTTSSMIDSGYGSDMAFAHDGADNSASWFRSMSRTRWTADPVPGTALLYGSQLVHGTLPVTNGRSRKFISWLFADSPTRSLC